MEVVGVCPPAVGLQGLEELESHSLVPAREGNVEMKLEGFWVNGELLRLIFVFFILSSFWDDES